MRRYSLSWCLVVFVLSPGMAALSAAAAPPGTHVSSDNALVEPSRQVFAALFTGGAAREVAAASILFGLLALVVLMPILISSRRLRKDVERLLASAWPTDTEGRLAAVTSESQALQASVEHLRQGWEAQAGRVESAVRELESRVADLEQERQRLTSRAQDLDDLRDFCDRVERIHAGIRKAFNGVLAEGSSPVLPDPETPAGEAWPAPAKMNPELREIRGKPRNPENVRDTILNPGG
jgi:hypothetical protein